MKERRIEGEVPQTNVNLPIETAYEQLAIWLGISKEEFAEKFNEEGFGNDENQIPTFVFICDDFYRGDGNFLTECKIFGKDNNYLIRKIVGYYLPYDIYVQNAAEK